VFFSVAGPAAKLDNGYTYSFVVQISSYLKRFKPKGVMICWDGGSTKREALLPNYKGSRPKSMNDTLRKYHEDVKRFCEAAGCDQLHAPGWEADDIGAMLANTSQRAVLVSNDKDWLQLVRPGIDIFHRCKQEGKKAEKKLITHTNFAEITGFTHPEEFVRFLCADGDGVDDIPGLFGVGTPVIKAYLLGMDIAPSKKAKLDEFFANSEHYLLNKQLIELRDVTEIPGLTLTPGKFDEERLLSLLNEFGFGSFASKFDTWVQPYKESNADLSPLS
jgi:5'-3' exonuclease